MGYPVLTAGMVLAPRGMGTMLLMFLVGRVVGRIDARLSVGTGLLVTAASLYERSMFTPDVDAWIKFSITCPRAGSVWIQPIRQPIIAQFFENVLTKRMRSSGDITSWNDGARLPSPQ